MGLVRLMVLPHFLDRAPPRRIAARQRSHPPGRVHHTLACGPAPARTRVLPAKGSTGTHDLLKVPTAANFLELRTCEVRRTNLPRGWVNSTHSSPSPTRTPSERSIPVCWRTTTPQRASVSLRVPEPQNWDRFSRPPIATTMQQDVHADPSRRENKVGRGVPSMGRSKRASVPSSGGSGDQ